MIVYESVCKNAIELMVDYIYAVKENDEESLEKIKSNYQSFRTDIIENQKEFKGLNQRQFLKTIVKHEDLSTTPKFVKKQLQLQKRYHFEVIMLFYLIALRLATDSIIDESIFKGIIAFFDMKLVLNICKEYDNINESLDDVKTFIKEYKYGNNN